MDCEQAGTESYAERACKIVCDGLIAAGYKAGVYSSLYWWNNYLSSVTEYTRWVAQWASACTYNGDYLMWQYGTGRVDGIGTAVDMNYLYENNDSNPSPDNPKTDDVIKPEITYQVFTDTSGWLPTVRNLEDYAGIDCQPIKGIRVYLNGDTLAVQTHQMSNGNIDKLTIFAGKNTIRYRVRVIGASDYFSWMENKWMENKKDTGGGSDTFAGEAGKSIDRIQITVK